MIAWPGGPVRTAPVGKHEELRVTRRGDRLELRVWKQMGGRDWMPTAAGFAIPVTAADRVAIALTGAAQDGKDR